MAGGFEGREDQGMMNRKTILRLTTDGLMTGFVFLSIANTLTGNAAHEIIGVLMIVLFILHQVLNWRWYPALVKGRYDTRRTVNTVVNGLLLVSFVVLIASSAMISRTLFSFLGIAFFGEDRYTFPALLVVAACAQIQAAHTRPTEKQVSIFPLKTFPSS